MSSLTFGSLGFGIPVELVKARKEWTPDIHMACPECEGSANMKFSCSVHGIKEKKEWNKSVKVGDKTKVVNPALLPKFEGREVKIEKLVKTDEVVKMYQKPIGLLFKDFWYVYSDKDKAKKILGAIHRKLLSDGLMGIGKVVLNTKQQLCLILPIGNALACATIYYKDEIKEPYELKPEMNKDIDTFLDGLKGTPDETFWENETQKWIEKIVNGEYVEPVVKEEEDSFLKAIKKEVKV